MNQLSAKKIEKEFRFNPKNNKARLTLVVNEPVYVYCPVGLQDQVSEVLHGYKIKFEINDFSITDFSGKVVCHYGKESLQVEHKDFLVSAINYGARVEPLLSYIDRRMGFTAAKLLDADYYLHQKAFSLLSKKRSKISKRIIDFLGSLVLSVIAIPIGLITALVIKMESKGPVFYKQLRVGQFNKEFEVIKFRSMVTDAEKGGAQWAASNDSRVTKVGNFIRKTRIDELPQLINVFKGEMSLVGPRPEREVFIKDLELHIPFYRFRHAVKPGITGLAQVSYPYGASLDDALWKHKFDTYYIKHHNFFLDINILLKTVKTVIFGMGR